MCIPCAEYVHWAEGNRADSIAPFIPVDGTVVQIETRTFQLSCSNTYWALRRHRPSQPGCAQVKMCGNTKVTQNHVCTLL